MTDRAATAAGVLQNSANVMSRIPKSLPHLVYSPQQQVGSANQLTPEASQAMFAPDVDEKLNAAASELQAFYREQDGIVYALEDLKAALSGWLEGAVEQLAQDAVWHCCTGHSTCAFNRTDFEDRLQMLHKRSAMSNRSSQPDRNAPPRS